MSKGSHTQNVSRSAFWLAIPALVLFTVSAWELWLATTAGYVLSRGGPIRFVDEPRMFWFHVIVSTILVLVNGIGLALMVALTISRLRSRSGPGQLDRDS